mmetsp:Transcript_16803/g.21833  ORF Transcript_16803/g.21833 Transcript_16803/m.21833 type:complete len:83 (+) Transcript_16803:84-332(+)
MTLMDLWNTLEKGDQQANMLISSINETHLTTFLIEILKIDYALLTTILTPDMHPEPQNRYVLPIQSMVHELQSIPIDAVFET